MPGLNEWVTRAGDRVEQVCGHAFALPIFTLGFLAGLWLIGVDATNIVVSYLTIALLLLTVGRDRADRKAVHAKLDDLERALPGGDNAKARLEERSESEIERAREGGQLWERG